MNRYQCSKIVRAAKIMPTASSYSPAKAFEEGYTLIAEEPPYRARVIEALRAVQVLVDEEQKAYEQGTADWHALETVDDRLHEALTRLGD